MIYLNFRNSGRSQTFFQKQNLRYGDHIRQLAKKGRSQTQTSKMAFFKESLFLQIETFSWEIICLNIGQSQEKWEITDLN